MQAATTTQRQCRRRTEVQTHTILFSNSARMDLLKMTWRDRVMMDGGGVSILARVEFKNMSYLQQFVFYSACISLSFSLLRPHQNEPLEELGTTISDSRAIIPRQDCPDTSTAQTKRLRQPVSAVSPALGFRVDLREAWVCVSVASLPVPPCS